jgi:hypothetical protein
MAVIFMNRVRTNSFVQCRRIRWPIRRPTGGKRDVSSWSDGSDEVSFRIIIGALSGRNLADRRERCRNTWFPVARAVGMMPLFLLSSPRPNGVVMLVGDELFLSCPDEYGTLTQRVQKFCQWAISKRGWTHLFKCDDDTYVECHRLSEVSLEGVDYLGRDIMFNNPALGHYASGGAGYFLSRKAAQIIAAANIPPVGSEDVEVGHALSAAGIHLIDDDRFIPSGGTLPEIGNDLITGHGIGHGVNADQFLACHARFVSVHSAIGRGCG